jgi:hypothetical protein
MSGKGKGNRNISIISNSGNDQAIGTNNVIHIDDRSSSVQSNMGKFDASKDINTDSQLNSHVERANSSGISMAQIDFNNQTLRALNCIASSVSHPSNNNEKQLFLEQRNTIRKLNGLQPVNYIYCAICNAINEHLTSNCPHAKCNICLNFGHTASNCNYNRICQYCNSNDHPTAGCKSNEAINIRSMRNKKCLVCGSWGHIASKCNLYNPRQNINSNSNIINARRRNKRNNRKIRRFKRIRKNK